MVYREKMVVVIKVDGKILREHGSKIYVPYNSEYSITLKNLNSVKAVAKIEVDGSNTMDGNQVIVPANESVTIEGFMKGRKVKNKFKFIEKTDQISAFRGDKASDGLVRITYQFEYIWPQQLYYTDPYSVIYGGSPSYGNNFEPTCKIGGYVPTGSSGDVKFAASHTSEISANFCTSETSKSSCKVKNKSNIPQSKFSVKRCTAMPENDNGITVKGSSSGQRFAVGSVGMLDAQKHVIVLELKGRLKKKKVYKAVTVKTKVQCETCGKKNKSRNKFCVNCGTSLI